MKVSIFFRMNPFLCFSVEEWPDSFEGKHQVLWMWVIFLVDPFIAAYAFVPASVKEHGNKRRVIASGRPSWSIAFYIWLSSVRPSLLVWLTLRCIFNLWLTLRCIFNLWLTLGGILNVYLTLGGSQIGL